MCALDACVVGAGAAGLVAARELARAGFTAHVLEARTRVGGRAWTDLETFGVPIDRGCAWLHNAPDNPWTAYARTRGFGIVERSPDWQRYIGKTPLSPERRRRWEAAWQRAEDAIAAAARAGRDVPVSTVLPGDLEFRTLFDAIMTWAMGVDTDALSTLDYATYDDTDVNWAVPDGLGKVVADAAAGLDVILGCEALEIDWSGDLVRVTTAQGTLECRAAVVTVPTTVLARGAPRFTPALPHGHEAAVHGLTLGVANKVFMELAPGAMPLEGSVHLVASDATTRTASVTVRPAGHELVQVFFGGAYARELEETGALESAARDELAGLFGSGLRNQIRRTAATAWLTDPWACGSYSAARPGFARCRTIFRES